MDVVLAVDLKGGYVVHGCSGNRETYAPLTWGLSPSAEPSAYLAVMQPKYLYVADLDRIAMCGDHTEQILRLAESSRVRSSHWVEAVMAAFMASAIRYRESEQIRSLRMGLRL